MVPLCVDGRPRQKQWEYRLITDDNICLGNSCKYTLGTARKISED